MKSIEHIVVTGEAVGETTVFSLVQLCRFCNVSSQDVARLVEHGAIEPLTDHADGQHFSGHDAVRALRAVRLQRDLGLNAAGAALALELLDRIRALQSTDTR